MGGFDNLSGRRTLVTGAAGFIGTAVCRALRRAGAEVHGVSRQPRSGEGISWWQADLADGDAVTEVFEVVRPELVFHLASHVMGTRSVDVVPQTFRDNLSSTVNLMTAASRADNPRVVMAGSMEEDHNGDANGIPGSPYAAAKMAATTYARMFHALFGLPVVNLRIFMVYGPGQGDTTKLIPYVTTALLRGEHPRLTAGARKIDWVYVDDVVSAFISAAGCSVADGEPVDIGSGRPASVRTVVEQVTKLVGGSARPEFGVVTERPLEHQRIADVTRSHKVLGWRPTTPLNEGLAQTVEWYRARANASAAF